MLNPVASTAAALPVTAGPRAVSVTVADKQAAMEAALQQVLKAMSVGREPDNPRWSALANLIWLTARRRGPVLIDTGDTVAKAARPVPPARRKHPGFFQRIADAIDRLPAQQRMVV